MGFVLVLKSSKRMKMNRGKGINSFPCRGIHSVTMHPIIHQMSESHYMITIEFYYYLNNYGEFVEHRCFMSWQCIFQSSKVFKVCLFYLFVYFYFFTFLVNWFLCYRFFFFWGIWVKDFVCKLLCFLKCLLHTLLGLIQLMEYLVIKMICN